MRFVLAICLSLTLAGVASAAPADDFAKQLKGPWGLVSADWKKLTGSLARHSCPADGVKSKESIGILSDGGAMWIDPVFAGAINVYEGSLAPRLFGFVRMDGATAAIYREGGADRRLSLEGDRLSMDRVPAAPGLPTTNYERCSVKK